MVFISLEGFVGPEEDESSSRRMRPPPIRIVSPPKPSIYVVVTPTSPVHQMRKSPLARRASFPPKSINQFCFCITDQVVHHKWVVTKSSHDYVSFRKEMTQVIGNCKTFRCCGPLRRVVKSPIYKQPQRKWNEDALVNQCLHSSVIEEYLNDLLQSILARECQCESTVKGRLLIYDFLEIAKQRHEVASRTLIAASEHVSSSPKTNSDDSSLTDPERLRSEQEETKPTSQDCPICFAPLEGQVARLPCDHSYHNGCLHTWLLEQHSCPVCRIDLRQNASSCQQQDAATSVAAVQVTSDDLTQ